MAKKKLDSRGPVPLRSDDEPILNLEPQQKLSLLLFLRHASAPKYSLSPSTPKERRGVPAPVFHCGAPVDLGP